MVDDNIIAMPNAPAHVAPPRLVFLGLAALTLAAVVMVASLGHSSMATRATTYALLAQSSLAIVLAIIHRDEVGSLRRAIQIFTMVVICLLTGAIGWFFGPNSGFAAFIALTMIMIGLLSRGPAVKRPQLVGWSLFASLAVGQAAVVIAVLSGLVPDASLTPVHRQGQSVGQLITSHIAIQGLYIAAFVVGRLFQRRYNELVQRIDETIRVTAQRD